MPTSVCFASLSLIRILYIKNLIIAIILFYVSRQATFYRVEKFDNIFANEKKFKVAQI